MGGGWHFFVFGVVWICFTFPFICFGFWGLRFPICLLGVYFVFVCVFRFCLASPLTILFEMILLTSSDLFFDWFKTYLGPVLFS